MAMTAVEPAVAKKCRRVILLLRMMQSLLMVSRRDAARCVAAVKYRLDSASRP
jgi:hypothetical protein